jgi:hypothetical protein
MSRALFEWIGKNGTYSSTVIMLSSPLQIDCMKRRLAARLDVRLSENMEAMLRFFDPRVLENLIKTLHAEQAKDFFSPAETWRYVDRAGNLVHIETAFNIQECFVAPLTLDHQQELTLLEGCEIDQVQSLLRESLSQQMTKFPLSEQHKFVSRTVNLAKEDGLESVLQFSIYTAAILLHGEVVAKRPLWRTFVDELRKSDFDSSGALSKIDFDEK